MADFLLSVGADVDESYIQLQKDIKKLSTMLAKDPVLVKVSLDVDGVSTKVIEKQLDTKKNIKKISKETSEDETVSLNKQIALYNKINRLVNSIGLNMQRRWTAATNTPSGVELSGISDFLSNLKEQDLSDSKIFDTVSQSVAEAELRIKDLNHEIQLGGKNTKAWGDRITGLASKFNTWFTLSQAIMAAYSTARKMITAVVELDTAMTELKKVTNETDEVYEKFLDNASTRAKNLGAALSDTVTATADFARLGYNLKEAEELADAAIVYKNVGDGIEDISEASESIIATMQAFGIAAEDSMSVVDKFNETGNNYAISSKGVGDALLRSAAAMDAANNSLDETIALATAANTIVQDPEKVGTTLKVVSMYLRAAKTEAEDAGESTDGMANSVSELRNEILALTGNKVDIQIDDNTFKSTYQILKELSQVWGDLTDISQANILEMVGGKRNANVVAALLENFSVAENALATSASASGSALAENEKYLDSIQGKMSQFKASFEALSSNAIDNEIVKDLIDIGTGLLNLTNQAARLNMVFGSLIALFYTFKGISVATHIHDIADALISGAKTADQMKSAVDALSSAEKKQLSIMIDNAVTKQALNSAEGALTATKAAEIKTTLGLAAANKTLDVSAKGLKATFKSLGAAIPVWGWIAIGAEVLISVISAISLAAEKSAQKMEELNSEFETLTSEISNSAGSYQQLATQFNQIVPRFTELADGVDQFGKNIQLTDEEYAEFLQLNNQIAEMFPELNLGMDENGNYMLALSYSSDTLTESLRAQLEVQRELAAQNAADKMPDLLDNVSEQSKTYENQIKELKADIEEYQTAISGLSSAGVTYINPYDDRVLALRRMLGQSKEEWDNFVSEYIKDEATASIDWGALVNSKEVQDALGSTVDKTETELNRLEGIVSSKWKKINQSAIAMTQLDPVYNKLDESLQAISLKMVGALNFEELGLSTQDEIENYIYNNILSPLNNATPEVQEAVASLSKLDNFTIGDGFDSSSYEEAVNKVLESLKELNVPEELRASIKDFYDEVAEGANKAAEANDNLANSASGMLSSLQKTENGLNQLDQIYTDIYNKGDFDWSSLIDEDFASQFGNLEAYENFVEVVANSPKDIAACQEAFNKLTSEYIYNSGVLKNVTDETKNLTVAFLQQQGVANASAIVDAQLSYNKSVLKYETAEFANMSYFEALGMYETVEAGEAEKEALAGLVLQKALLNANEIDTTSEIEQLINVANAANVTTESYKRLAQARDYMMKAERYEQAAKESQSVSDKTHYLNDAKKYYNLAQEILTDAKTYQYNAIDPNKFKVSYSGGSSYRDAVKSAEEAAKKSAEKQETWFEKEYAYHQHLRNMNQESEENYLSWLNSAYKRAYNERIIELDDYYKYQEEVYSGLQDLFKDYLSDIEHEISMRENFDGESKKIIQLYRKLISEVEKEIKSARANGLSDTDDYIQELQGKWQDYSDAIKEIQEDTTEAAKDAVKDLVDIRIDMLKQDLENEKDAIEEKLDKLKEFYDKQKEMLQDQYDEEKYLEDQSEKRKTVADIQAEIAQLEYDNSAWAQKRKLELAEELADAQKDLNDFEKDHALETAQDELDKIYEMQEEEMNAELELLDKKINDAKALYDQAIADIKNGSTALYEEMILWNQKYGDGIDETIKTSWENAYVALKNYYDLYGKYYENIKLSNATGYNPPKGSWDSSNISGTNPSNKKPPVSKPSGGSSAGQATNKPSLSKGSTVTVKKTATHFGSKSKGVRMDSFVPGSKFTVYQTSGDQVLIGLNGVYTGWIKKTDIVGYAKGTRKATPGLHRIDELGVETIFESADGSRYKMFSGGEKVLNAKASNFLYDFANGGNDILIKLIKSLFDNNSLNNISTSNNYNEINMGDIIVRGNADKQTVSEIRRAQRESLTEMLKSFNNLNK